MSEVEAYARGLLRPDCQQHNFIAQALNDLVTERGAGYPVGYQFGNRLAAQQAWGSLRRAASRAPAGQHRAGQSGQACFL